MTTVTIPEVYIKGKRLGRHVQHDPRSLSYLFNAEGVPLKTIFHKRYIPVLDQGDLGSCTGNAMTGYLGSASAYEIAYAILHLSPTDSAANEKIAVALYETATTLDDFDGSYPPDDTGSSGVAVAKAAKRAGVLSGYTHTTSLDTALAALAKQPVIIGINWYSSFDQPDHNGLVTIPKDAYVRGGHEVVLDGLDVENKLVWATNSWSDQWGNQGKFAMTWDTFGRLLSESGDCTVPVLISSPAPVPTPIPTPVPPTPVVPPFSLMEWLRALWQRLTGQK